ncbi:major facilitator superfamily protein, putative [Ichthyophthirius multifiliis]|uniref:UNC93-like protein MFSD11 n=1 Tax=Ichthyophthirius multifiliis TaxID=5932 RepID=G0R2P2_ICHMU|nr:major facilitator superfamily protein, putative [Ichthyophthirius multifiliis]EGR28258.1 major facilitator superfamily protein, putative [Ichthyophthirius multifiliis]|eukprot:XP_004027603.1 major facilitator superfamily protein, putative [Ichthyophthirius multifiliis]
MQDKLIKELNLENQTIDPQEAKKIYNSSKVKIQILSFSFMLLFSAFNSAQNLVGTLYENLEYNNLGLISLLVLYAVFAIACLFAKYIIKKLSFKITFILSSMGYNFYSASGIWVCLCYKENSKSGVCSTEVIYFIVLLSASLCGMAASTIWIAQGSYIDTLCIKSREMRGNLFGIFWAIQQSSLIAGALLGSFVLKYLDNLYYFIIMTSLGLVATLFFFLLPNVQQQNNEETQPIKQQISNVFKLMMGKKVRPFIPFMVMAGIIVGFYSGFLNKLVENSMGFSDYPLNKNEKDDLSQNLSYVLISLGVFEIFGGIISGKLADKFCVYKLATLDQIKKQQN